MPSSFRAAPRPTSLTVTSVIATAILAAVGFGAFKVIPRKPPYFTPGATSW